MLISSLVFLKDLFSNELENGIYIEITKTDTTHLLFSIITMTATKKQSNSLWRCEKIYHLTLFCALSMTNRNTQVDSNENYFHTEEIFSII